MSKLDELIQELCPDGVEYKRLGDVATISRGVRVVKSQLASEGLYPVFQNSMTPLGFFKKANCSANSTFVIGAGAAGEIGYSYVDFWAADDCFYFVCSAKLLSRYLYHTLLWKKNIIGSQVRRSSIPRLPRLALENLEIPVPPLEVQHEIVRILDNFTELTAELTEKLVAELTARKKQYDYYRDRLLTFDAQENVVMLSLADVADISTGSSNTDDAVEGGEYPFYVRSQEPLRKNEYEYDEEAIITAGDGVGVGKVFHYVNGKYALHQRAYRIHPTASDLSGKYLYHYFVAKFPAYIGKQMYQSSVPSIRRPMLNKFEIAVPTLNVQEKIVQVLDNFDAICTDLNIGLPAEIEARQKQYEYYRDALLTFAETGTILALVSQSVSQSVSQNLIRLIQYVFGFAFVTLKDVVLRSNSGGTPLKGNADYYNDGDIPWLRTQEVTFNEIHKTECFITEEGLKNSAAKWIPENCVIVAISGASAGRCAINKIPLTTNQHCLNLEINPAVAMYRYIYYCICAMKEDLLSKKEGARGDLNASRILSLLIPLPSLKEQQRIVSILDRFDAICNNLSAGLPAEIEARQKQYEYYRDKLLTFKPAE